MTERQSQGSWSRRAVLLGSATLATASLAGCSGLNWPWQDDDGDVEPPGTEFGVSFDRDDATYTITYEGDSTFNQYNTNLLAVDHVTETGAGARNPWFDGPDADPITEGDASTWGYDGQRVTVLEIVWMPSGVAESERWPAIIARESTPRA